MLIKALILFAITLVPAFELRASIPYGILGGNISLPFGITVHGMKMDWRIVFAICVFSNIILGTLFFPLLNRIMNIMERIPIVEKLWIKFILHAQKKLTPYVRRWGVIGVALFIAIPLPGSGAYTGAVGAYLMGMRYKRFLIANVIGVILAGIAVTAATLTGRGIFDLLF